MNKREEILKRLREFDSENKTDDELLRILEERTRYKEKIGKGSDVRYVVKSLSDEQKLDFLYFAKRNDLNPIYDLWACCIGGELRPYISVNGWCNILQKHIANKVVGGVKWEYSEIKNIEIDGARLKTYEWIECTIVFADGRNFSFRSTIYDNFSNNDIWKKYAGKMLQNKVLSGALRMYVSKEKLYDDDEVCKIQQIEDTPTLNQAGEVIRKIRQGNFGNIQRMTINDGKLQIKATMDASKFLGANGFIFNQKDGIWEQNVVIDNNDIDTILVQNNLEYNTKESISNGINKMFYQVLKVNQRQRETLEKLGFSLFGEKGYIKAI